MPEPEVTGQESSQPSLYDMVNTLPAGEKVAAPEGETPVVETPAVETPIVETTETPVVEKTAEPVAETPAVETPIVETPIVETPTVFEINDINQRFETSFADESEFKLALDDSKRIGELQEQVKELEKVKAENILIKENLDPMNYFDSEDEYKASLFRKQFPDKDAATAFQLISSDISQMAPKDLIAYEMMLNTPGITKVEADAVVNQTYNIEEGEEISPNDAVRVKVDGATASRNINALKSQIKVPEKVDVDSLVAQKQTDLLARKEKLTNDWGTIGKEVERTFNDLTVSGKDTDDSDWSFTYSMSKDFPSDVTQSMVESMANTGTELTKEAVQKLGTEMRKEYFNRNINNIVTAVREDTLAKAKEKQLKEQHNTETPNTDAPPTGDGSSETSDRIMGELNKGYAPSTFMKK